MNRAMVNSIAVNDVADLPEPGPEPKPLVDDCVVMGSNRDAIAQRTDWAVIGGGLSRLG